MSDGSPSGSDWQDPNDARDPAAAERLEAVDPDGFMRRREFLQRAALTGGLAMSMASVLSPDAILGEAAAPRPRRRPRREEPAARHDRRADDGEPLLRPLPRLAAGGGRSPGRAHLHRRGRRSSSKPTGWRPTGRAAPTPIPTTPGTGEGPARRRPHGRLPALGRKRRVLDRLLRRTGPAVHPLGGARVHHLRPLLLLAARLDLPQPRVHALGPVLRDEGQHLPVRTAEFSAGFPDTTIFASLAAAGVSNRYFYTDIPVSALWGAPGIARSGQVQEYYERCAHRHPAGGLLRRPVLRGRGTGHLRRRTSAR